MMLEHTFYGVNRAIAWENTAHRHRRLIFGQGEAREADELRKTKGRRGFCRKRIAEEAGSRTAAH